MFKRWSAWRYLWKSIDIRQKLLITFLLLVIYRLAANIPVPGIDPSVLASLTQGTGAAANLVNLLNLLSGGTLAKFSVMAMGVYPYITAQIIIQLVVPIIPALEQKMKENPREGQIWQEKWTILLTIPMALLSAIGQINIFSQLAGAPVIPNFGLTGPYVVPSITILVTMTAGTMFGVWIGQLISEFGIPKQGLSLVIFAGIVSQIPVNMLSLLADRTSGVWMMIIISLLLALMIFAIVYVQQGRRNVPVFFPGRRMGNRMSMPVNSKLPLMVNMAGMIPLIFAQAILSFPAIIASYFVASPVPWISNMALGIQNTFNGSSPVYALIYFLMVVAFSFFYTDVLFAQQNYGENLKRQGAHIPGVTVGAATQKYLTRVQRRITIPGALFLGFVAVLPFVLQYLFPVSARAGLFLISASGLLIVVGVVRDTFTIIETELKLHGYQESLIKG
jgi:preprotein translocase subunit SecY